MRAIFYATYNSAVPNFWNICFNIHQSIRVSSWYSYNENSIQIHSDRLIDVLFIFLYMKMRIPGNVFWAIRWCAIRVIYYPFLMDKSNAQEWNRTKRPSIANNGKIYVLLLLFLRTYISTKLMNIDSQKHQYADFFSLTKYGSMLNFKSIGSKTRSSPIQIFLIFVSYRNCVFRVFRAKIEIRQKLRTDCVEQFAFISAIKNLFLLELKHQGK